MLGLFSQKCAAEENGEEPMSFELVGVSYYLSTVKHLCLYLKQTGSTFYEKINYRERKNKQNGWLKSVY